MLGCDGCGAIVQDRGADEARQWFALTVGPAIEGGTILPSITFGALDDELPDDEPLELEPIEPTRHFCGLDCLGAWVARAQEAQAHPPTP
jgi:hypothetical protein